MFDRCDAGAFDEWVANLDKPGAGAGGGRVGVSDVVAEDHLTPEQRSSRGGSDTHVAAYPEGANEPWTRRCTPPEWILRLLRGRSDVGRRVL